MTGYRYWKPEEDEVISKAEKPLNIGALALRLRRTKSSIKNRAHKLDVSTAKERKRHKGNNPVKQKHIDEAVELYKKHGTAQAASDASDVPYGRMCYLLKLARLYGQLAPSGHSPGTLSETQKKVLEWIRKNPGQKTNACIAFFRRHGAGYYTIKNAHEALRRKKLIKADGILWTSIK